MQYTHKTRIRSVIFLNFNHSKNSVLCEFLRLIYPYSLSLFHRHWGKMNKIRKMDLIRIIIGPNPSNVQKTICIFCAIYSICLLIKVMYWDCSLFIVMNIDAIITLLVRTMGLQDSCRVYMFSWTRTELSYGRYLWSSSLPAKLISPISPSMTSNVYFVLGLGYTQELGWISLAHWR